MKLRKFSAWILALAILSSTLFVVKPASANSGVCYSVEPVAVPPMTDGDPSPNILHILEWPSAGINFNVEIHLRGATLANVAAGIIGLEVHLDFTELLAYAAIVGFTDYLGGSGGVFNAPVLEEPAWRHIQG